MKKCLKTFIKDITGTTIKKEILNDTNKRKLIY